MQSIKEREERKTEILVATRRCISLQSAISTLLRAISASLTRRNRSRNVYYFPLIKALILKTHHVQSIRVKHSISLFKQILADCQLLPRYKREKITNRAWKTKERIDIHKVRRDIS